MLASVKMLMVKENKWRMLFASSDVLGSKTVKLPFVLFCVLCNLMYLANHTYFSTVTLKPPTCLFLPLTFLKIRDQMPSLHNYFIVIIFTALIKIKKSHIHSSDLVRKLLL